VTSWQTTAELLAASTSVCRQWQVGCLVLAICMVYMVYMVEVSAWYKNVPFSLMCVVVDSNRNCHNLRLLYNFGHASICVHMLTKKKKKPLQTS